MMTRTGPLVLLAPDTQPTDCQSAGFDPCVAHPARVYAFWLGGKDHYPADREAA
jgi:hypothetical protein